jgi:ABC-type phosphate transport system auxiliary subunit
MSSEQKIRSRVAAQLASLLKDEKAHLAKYRRTRNLILIVGIAFLLVAWAIAGTPWNWTAAAAASMALVGGFLCGLTVAYDNSAQSWPILKPLLRDHALDLLKGETP